MPGENENMSAGTIKLTNGSTAVVGTSTTFTSDLKSGDVISTTISGVPYTLFVDTVTSNTALTLSDVFTGPTTTGAAYVAVPQMTLNRITAALAAQTAEAVRRVLQENANWQAFYSGTGDITVTLPNGTPTGVQIPGPSWAKLAGVANSAWIDRGPVGTADNINTYNPNTTEGEWYKSVPTGLTTANGFPDGAVQGTLKVVAGGRWNGTQIYADYNGNQWVRTLTAAWNGTDGPWGAWVITGMGALALLGINTLASRSSLDWNADDFPVGSYFMVTGSSMTNVPAGVTVVGVNQYYIRVVGGAGNTRIVEMCNSSTGGTGGLDYQKYEIRLGGTPGSRTLIARQIWTSSSLLPLSAGGLGANTAAGGRTTLGFDDMGLGPASQSLLTAFDWQQVDFASGANYLVNVAGWTNAPAGLLTPSTDVVNIGVLLCRTNANLFVVNITSQASNGANRYDYNVRVNGAKGSRTFTVIQNYNSDTTTIIPLGNGGTGSTTAAAARTALGVAYGTTAGTVAAGNDSRITGAVQNTGGNITGSFVLSASGAYLSNAAAARYAVGGVTYLDIWRFTQIDIGGVGTQGNLQFVANPGNYLSFELAPGNGSHSFRHDGKIVTNAGTVAFTGSDSRIKNKKGKPTGSARDRISTLAATATQDYLWLNYQGDINTYRYEQPQRGFIAQDAYAVDPTYASKPQNGADDEMPENGDAIWGVNTNAIVADVVLAVDEQQTDIDGLRQTVADLQTQIAQLSQQIQAFSQPAAQS